MPCFEYRKGIDIAEVYHYISEREAISCGCIRLYIHHVFYRSPEYMKCGKKASLYMAWGKLIRSKRCASLFIFYTCIYTYPMDRVNDADQWPFSDWLGDPPVRKWIPITKVSDAEPWSERTIEQTIETRVISYDVAVIMTSL